MFNAVFLKRMSGERLHCKLIVTWRHLTGCFLWEQFAKLGNTQTHVFYTLAFTRK